MSTQLSDWVGGRWHGIQNMNATGLELTRLDFVQIHRLTQCGNNQVNTSPNVICLSIQCSHTPFFPPLYVLNCDLCGQIKGSAHCIPVVCRIADIGHSIIFIQHAVFKTSVIWPSTELHCLVKAS